MCELFYDTLVAGQDYDLLIEYWGTRDTVLKDIEIESQALEKLREGAAESISELGLD